MYNNILIKTCGILLMLKEYIYVDDDKKTNIVIKTNINRRHNYHRHHHQIIQEHATATPLL